jgi:hypothetical protein
MAEVPSSMMLDSDLEERTGIDQVGTDTRGGIGWALKHLWNYRKVTRDGWSQPSDYLKMHWPAPGDMDRRRMTLPFVYITTEDGGRHPWVCRQDDLLAFDWRVIS